MSHAHPTRRIDLLGRQFGNWTVIAFAGIGSSKSARWLCRCECGKEREIPGTRLRNGKSTGCLSCRSGKAKHAEDLTGRVFCRWTVIAFSHKTDSRNRYWRCRCECGREDAVMGNHLKSGFSAGCRSCKARRMERPAHGRYWRNVQAGAAARGYEVTVSMDEAFAILERQDFACALTGEPIKIADSVKGHVAGETTASLDRIDSSKGYVPGNLQWLHKDVNRLKSTLGQDRFIQLCRTVAARYPDAQTHETRSNYCFGELRGFP